MASDGEKQKVHIASEFLLHAPPGEFNEVFNDVRLLLNNDELLKNGCAKAFAQYNKDQYTPVRLENMAEKPTLITTFNDYGNGRFYVPRTQQSFRYDHLRKEASEFTKADSLPGSGEAIDKFEPLRSAIQQQADQYIVNHYSKSGTAAVFAGTDSSTGQPSYNLCIESHQFQPKNFWNGRWRSQWSVKIPPGEKSVELIGHIKVQVHYYEDGNVQLVSSKEISRRFNITNDQQTAKEMLKIIEEEETTYQSAVSENYETMSGTTFKALRRQLPVTRTKVDWLKIQNYKVGAELRPQ